MKLAFVGYGGMGKAARRIAEERGHDVVAVIDPAAKGATAPAVSKEALNGAEVAIEFSRPDVVMGNVKSIVGTKTSCIIGTTGWYEKLEEMRALVLASGVGALWSSNLSIGVNLYFRIVEAAARLMDSCDEYDLWASEIHHHFKADSPSGTAKSLEKILLAHIKRKTAVVEGKLDRRIEPHEFHFSSTRGGPVNFGHTIGFDSAADTITLTHTARSRDGYALGAIKAAEWIAGKKGFYSMEDFLAAVK